jgi:hypothetical protein
MEKNWERSAKVFGHRQAISDVPVYPTTTWVFFCSQHPKNSGICHTFDQQNIDKGRHNMIWQNQIQYGNLTMVSNRSLIPITTCLWMHPINLIWLIYIYIYIYIYIFIYLYTHIINLYWNQCFHVWHKNSSIKLMGIRIFLGIKHSYKTKYNMVTVFFHSILW